MKKEDILWKRGSLNIKGKEFFVSDDETRTISQLLEYIIEPDLIDKIDELFSPEGNGYPYGDEDIFIAIRITKKTLHYLEWKNNNPFDLKEEEIWLIKSYDNYVVLKGEDLRYLLNEAKKLWLDNYEHYLEELRSWIWQKTDTNVKIDKKGFHVINDNENEILAKLLSTFSSPARKNEVDNMFSPNGKGYRDPILFIYRCTDPREFPFVEWQENNPWDLKKEEIWIISDDFNGQEVIKGEDWRYLIKETRSIWPQWENFQKSYKE